MKCLFTFLISVFCSLICLGQNVTNDWIGWSGYIGMVRTTVPSSVTSSDVTHDLSDWWKFDELSGSVAADSSGTNKGTWAGTITVSNGVMGKAINTAAGSIQFGSTNTCDIYNAVGGAITNSGCSFSFWVYPLGYNGSNQRIFTRTSGNTG